jgi:anti-anti-sigma factor
MRSQLRTTERSGVSVLAPEGELDLATIDALSQPLQRAAKNGGPVVVDLSLTEFIDSLTIAAIVSAAHDTNTVRPIRLHVTVRPGTQPARVWSITGLADFIPTFSTVEAAVEHLAGADPDPAESPADPGG